MGLALAFAEAALLVAVASGTIVFWPAVSMTDWRNTALVLVKAGLLASCCVASFYYHDLYDLRVVRDIHEFGSRLLQSFGAAFILLAGVYAVFPEANFGSGAFVVNVLVATALLFPLRAVAYGVMRRRVVSRRVLIVGTSPLACKIAEEITSGPHFGCSVVGLVDGTAAPTEAPGSLPLFGPIERIRKIIAELRPDSIVVALRERRSRLPMKELLEARMSGILVEDGIEVYERLTGKLAIESLTPSVLIFSRDFRRSRLAQVVQRGVSLAVAALGLLVIAPWLAVIALLIKLESNGPVFFVQARAGRHGRHFNLIKFRTMRPAPAVVSEWARDNADRITRVGRWLRHFRLDELPQFVNILRGDMNLVGPRPHPVSNFELFMERVPYYALRTTVRPGLTGWSQVRYGYANSLEEETEKMRYDLYYIKHLSVGLDLRILFDTIKIVLVGRGSQAVAEAPALATMGRGAR